MRAVLTFHSIDDGVSPLSFSRTSLEAMLDIFYEGGVSILSLDDLLMDDQRDGVAITFDDGISSVFHEALPIFRDRKIPAHVFVVSNWVGRDNRWPSQPTGAPPLRLMDWDQLEAMQRAGFRIEGHTANHPDLRTLTEAAIEQEMCDADEIIQRRLGSRPRYFAYPFGCLNDVSKSVAGRLYKASFTTKLDYLRPGMAPHALPRLDAYYLRSTRLVRQLGSIEARAYVFVRRALRRLRGH